MFTVYLRIVGGHLSLRYFVSVKQSHGWTTSRLLGYGGSVGALKSMDALEMGLTEEELQP